MKKTCISLPMILLAILLLVGLGYIFRNDVAAIMDRDTRCR